jgi:hypothetical protein
MDASWSFSQQPIKRVRDPYVPTSRIGRSIRLFGIRIGVLPWSRNRRASVKAWHGPARSGRLSLGQVVPTIGIRISPVVRFPAQFNAQSILPAPVGESSTTPRTSHSSRQDRLQYVFVLSSLRWCVGFSSVVAFVPRNFSLADGRQVG